LATTGGINTRNRIATYIIDGGVATHLKSVSGSGDVGADVQPRTGVPPRLAALISHGSSSFSSLVSNNHLLS